MWLEKPLDVSTRRDRIVGLDQVSLDICIEESSSPDLSCLGKLRGFGDLAVRVVVMLSNVRIERIVRAGQHLFGKSVVCQVGKAELSARNLKVWCRVNFLIS